MTMSRKILINLPEEVFSAIRKKPEDFIREMRIAAAVKWYELGMVSQSKGSEIAGVTRREFLDALCLMKVSPFQATPEELSEKISDG